MSGFEGKHHTREAKKKIGKAQSWLGKHHSEDSKKKISKAKMGNTAWLGKHHTELTKKKMSQSHIGKPRLAISNQRESDAKIGKMPKNLQYPGKFGNVKRGWYDILGIRMFFRSKWEVNYCLYLNFLIKQKQIRKWEYEPDVFVFEAIKFGTRSYRPDFKVYNSDDSITYHEVKGFMDSKSKTKLKRMAKYYPNIKLLIIDKDVYTDIKKKLGKMLKFYE